jgi:mono/diheme cytochrome c family protein
MNPASIYARALAAGLLTGVLTALGLGQAVADDGKPDPALVDRGRYLAKAADCMPCHTSGSDKPFAGGLKMDTPFGAIYSPNITPDPETGIGKWSFDDFRNAVHAGIRADGKYLYPAMPFDAFAKINEGDLQAMWAYFRSLPPTRQQNRANDLSFPFNIRTGMLVWRTLFFSERPLSPDPQKDAQWNRGAYLVEALGHCGDCHTPRNLMGATIASKRFQGTQIDQWYAPDITAETLANVNRWDQAKLVAFLRSGSAANSTSLGPMQEVVHDSLSSLTASDLDAMATYLLDGRGGEGAPKPTPVAKLAPAVEKHAAELYADNCASCHQTNGQGVAGSVPPLASNPAVVARRPYNVLAAVLQGLPARANVMAMPSFAGALNDADVANLANYLRTSWGNQSAPSATPDMVATWRSSLSLPLYADNAARTFDCPTVGQGGDPGLDPAMIAAMSAEMAQRFMPYATLVREYKAQRPDAGMTDIVNNLVAAYCPVVAQNGASDQAKSATLKRFALNLTAYLADQSVGDVGPNVPIIWAVAVGYSLAEREPLPQSKLDCPANDNSRVPQALVTVAGQIADKPDLNFAARDAIAQADAMFSGNPGAKPANLANALILSFCRGVMALPGVGEPEKLAGVMRYGQEVIEALQAKAETQARAPAAMKAQSETVGKGRGRP